MKENSFVDFIKNSVDSIVPTIDTKTIVGEPVSLKNGKKIFPLIKISVGYVVGGGEYKQKKQKKPFAAGATSGCVAEPVGFLVVDKNGQNFVPINQQNLLGEVALKLSSAMAYLLKKNGKATLKKVEGKLKNDEK